MAAINSQGTVIAISTGLGTPVTITGASKAAQCVITATNSFVAGDQVKITGVAGMTQLNNNSYTVVSSTGTAFVIAVDSTNFTTWASGGTQQATPYNFVTGCSITSVDGFDGSAGEIDVTTMCSLSKEYQTALQDAGNVKFDGFFDKDTNDLFQAECRKAKAAATVRRFKITLPQSYGFVGFSGFVKTAPMNFGVDQVIKTSFDVRITGVVDIV